MADGAGVDEAATEGQRRNLEQAWRAAGKPEGGPFGKPAAPAPAGPSHGRPPPGREPPRLLGRPQMLAWLHENGFITSPSEVANIAGIEQLSVRETLTRPSSGMSTSITVLIWEGRAFTLISRVGP